jgi:PAS domain S-box-containing protein
LNAPTADLGRLPQQVADSLPVLISYIDASGRYRFVNRTYETWLRLDRRDVVGREIREVLGEAGYQKIRSEVDRTMAGETLRFEREMAYPDGITRVVDITYVPHILEGRVVGLCALVADVTTVRQSMEREMLLAREIDHRARNALAVVQSLIHLTPFSSRQQFVDDLTGRVQAMGRAHTLLSSNAWRGATLEDLIRSELQAVDALGRADLDGPAFRLTLETAQPVSMLFHELVTNAVKHGALSAPQGQIQVSWRAAPPRGLELDWRESGGPATRPPERKGFGTRLIDSLAGQLGARLQRDWRADGLDLRLSIRSGLAAEPVAPAIALESPAVSGEGGLKGRRVLVVEDEAVVAMELTALLRASGAIVVGPAISLQQGLVLAGEEAFDCALLDVNLGGDHVSPLAELIRAKGAPFVLVTGYDAPGFEDEATVLRKPVEHQAVLAAIEARLA